ncbi:MAG: SUF system Fe-S cluster assembly protein [Myxococcales bacterium]|nr:SUF system Fe-S cluster assembly protein [Myxococcales bacterium]
MHSADSLGELRAEIVRALRSCYDPEIPVNIFDLGLIYDTAVARDGSVSIEMTLTSPACPVAGELPGDVERRIREVEGVTSCRVELVWEPAWSPERMTEAAKLELGFF